MCFSFVDYSYFRTETPHLSLSLYPSLDCYAIEEMSQ